MEKIYKVKMYSINKYNERMDFNRYTKKMLIDMINEMTNSDSKTLDDAINNLTNYRIEHGLTKWTIVESYIEISNDDIVGNIKPDNSFTNTLELGPFKNVIDDDSYIIREFSTLTNSQKYELFLAIDYNETQSIISRMDIFNNMDIEKLIEFLNETIENFTVKQLLSTEEFKDPISKGFWLKIIEENMKLQSEIIE